METNYQYVALDCEYQPGRQRGGRDHPNNQAILTHVALVNSSGEVFLEAKCENTHPGVPTRKYRIETNGVFSGCFSWASCRQKIASLLQGKILVGHDVRHDLKVLNLTHPEQFTLDTAYQPPIYAANHSFQPLAASSFARIGAGISRSRPGLAQSRGGRKSAKAAMDLFKQVELLRQYQELWYASRDGKVDKVKSLLEEDCLSKPAVLNFLQGGEGGVTPPA